MILTGTIIISMTGCVNQHPENSTNTSTNGETQERIVATSPSVVAICDKLDIDLVGFVKHQAHFRQDMLRLHRSEWL